MDFSWQKTKKKEVLHDILVIKSANIWHTSVAAILDFAHGDLKMTLNTKGPHKTITVHDVSDHNQTEQMVHAQRTPAQVVIVVHTAIVRCSYLKLSRAGDQDYVNDYEQEVWQKVQHDKQLRPRQPNVLRWPKRNQIVIDNCLQWEKESTDPAECNKASRPLDFCRAPR